MTDQAPRIKLSKPQQVALRTCHEHQGTLRRWPGGFWTYPGVRYDNYSKGIPEWWTVTATIRCLERLGLLIRAHEQDEEWRDTRITTPLGRAIAETLVESSRV